MTEPNWDEVYLSNHASRVTSSRAWFDSAVELVAAAEALAPLALEWWESLAIWERDRTRIFNEHSYHQTYLMLYAFALENYCKGSLVGTLDADERAMLRARGRFPKRLRTHDLTELTEAVAFPLTVEGDEELLRRLTHAAIWTGRYPVSLDYRGNFVEQFSDGDSYRLSYVGHDDIDRVRNLAHRLRSHVGARESYRVSRGA